MKTDTKALMKQPTKKVNFNLTHEEYIAVEELAKGKDLITTNADKDGTVFILQMKLRQRSQMAILRQSKSQTIN